MWQPLALGARDPSIQLLLQFCLAESMEMTGDGMADSRDELQTYPVSYERSTDQRANDIPLHDA